MKDKNQNDKEPWNQTFDDATDDEGNLSRTKLRKQNKSNSLISIILISAIVLIMAFALLFGVMKSTGGTDSSSSSIASTKVQSVSTSKEKSATKENSSKKASTRTEKASSESAKSSSIEKAKQSSESKSKQSSKTDSSSSSNSSASGDYVTVQAGQGLYRVATNAGISEQQLLELNGLSSASQIHPGQKLRVK